MSRLRLENIEADMHCHSLVSVHAYSTIGELALGARDIGLKAFAITDHGPSGPDSPQLVHFDGLNSLPDYMEGVRVYKGVEANITSYNGDLDLPDSTLRKLEWVIASLHDSTCRPGNIEQNTAAYEALCSNPYVAVIGHSATEAFAYDYEKVIPLFGRSGKLVEINENQAKQARCAHIAELCKKYSVPVVIDSDAHNRYSLRRLGDCVELLNSIDFPEELVINASLARLDSWIHQHCMDARNY